ncbi:MAG TPA: DoxX family protein [Niabella sp.]|nr:DoxX family protein [Niabella sp.]
MKKQKIIFWTATIIIFLWEGLMPLGTLLFAPEYANAGTKPLGYPDYFAYALIICKVLGSTALIIPRLNPKLKEWAYAGLTFNLVFAVISHIVVDKNIGFILMPIVVGIILAVSYFSNQKIQRNVKNKFQNY